MIVMGQSHLDKSCEQTRSEWALARSGECLILHINNPKDAIQDTRDQKGVIHRVAHYGHTSAHTARVWNIIILFTEQGLVRLLCVSVAVLQHQHVCLTRDKSRHAARHSFDLRAPSEQKELLHTATGHNNDNRDELNSVGGALTHRWEQR